MPLNTAHVDGKARAARSMAVAMAVAIALAGCAAGPGGPAAGVAPYVGVFTGEYVDGKPLYRFPSIHVVGSRSSPGDL